MLCGIPLQCPHWCWPLYCQLLLKQNSCVTKPSFSDDKTKENGGKMLLVQVSGCTQQTCLWYKPTLKTLKPFTKSQIEKGWGIHELCGVTVKGFNNALFQKGILGVLLLSQGNQDWKQRSCTRHTNMFTCWVPDLLQMEICPLYIPRARCCPSAVHAAHNTCWCPLTMW